MIRTSAHAVERPLLQHPQQLALCGRRQLADLVQEHGPAFGELELAQAPPRRAREGPTLVAEKLALEQGVRDRGAVDRDEWPLPPRGEHVDGAGEELLARSALSLEKNRRVGRGHALRLGANGLERGRLADDRRHLPGLRLGKQQRLALTGAPLDGALDHQAQQVRVHGLGDEILGSAFHRVHGRFDRAEGRHHENGQRRVDRPSRVENRQPVGAGQAPVGQDDIHGPSRAQALDRGRAAGDAFDAVPFGSQHLLEHLPQRCLVFDDEDGGHARLG
jgi:hypothetical protein